MNKQIEEMTDIITRTDPKSWAKAIATSLYNADYRKQSEWISVEDRLPEDDYRRYLIYFPYGGGRCLITIAGYDHSLNIWIGADNARYYKNPTHWLPLPEAPKMKGGEQE